MKTICVFGDSITWGAWDNEKRGWVNRLKLFLCKDNGVEVYNLGISGDKTEDVLERFGEEAKVREPTDIIFAIGINDTFHGSEELSGIDINKFKENLNELIRQAKKFTHRIVFIGLTRVNESEVEKSYKNELIQEYDKILKDVCDENSLLYIEMFTLLNDSDLEDGLHPNAEGHKKIFKKVKELIVK